MAASLPHVVKVFGDTFTSETICESHQRWPWQRSAMEAAASGSGTNKQYTVPQLLPICADCQFIWAATFGRFDKLGFKRLFCHTELAPPDPHVAALCDYTANINAAKTRIMTGQPLAAKPAVQDKNYDKQKAPMQCPLHFLTTNHHIQ